MILCDEHGEPLAFSVKIEPLYSSGGWNDGSQIVLGHLETLGDPKRTLREFLDDPIGLVFVPEYGQEIREELR